MNATPVQEFALELCMVADQREKSRDLVNQMKLALVGHDPGKYLPLFFGDAMATPTIDQEIADDFDPTVEDTAGAWEFTEQVSPEDAQAMLMEMLATPSGTITDDGWK